MSDLRNRLERLGDRADVAPDAFERLERARKRRERNRRIAAGAVALLVAIAGTVAAYAAFRTTDDGRTVAGGGQDGFFALWPESTLEAAVAAQRAVDDGDSSLTWRLNPLETAQRFVNEALGWPESEYQFAVQSATTAPDGTVTVDLGNGVDPGTCNRPECDGRDVILRLRRLVEADGIWSVASVESPVFNIPLHPGETVEVGSELSIAAGWPDGTKVAVGFAGTGSCSAFHEDTVDVSDLAVTTRVSGVPDGCAGYVYALTPYTEQGSVELGSIVFPRGGANLKPDLAYMVTSIAAVPVRFSASPQAKATDVAEFTCDGTGTGTIAPSTATVDAQPDGVHVAVTNLAGERISFTVGGSEDTTMYVVGQGQADPGERTELVVAVPPGDAHVSCVVASKSGIDTAPVADLKVADPSGSYFPLGMTCAMSSRPTKDATAFGGDPFEVTRQHLSGLEYDDAVERAGYPQSDKPIVRVRRNGDVVAMATFRDDGQGGWRIETLVTCANVPIEWTNDIGGVSGPMGPTSPASALDQLCTSARADGSGTAHNGSDLSIEGRDIAFDTRCLIAPAGQPITIRFRNEDQAVPRNLSIYPMTPYLRELLVTGALPSQDIGRPVFDAEFVAGVGETRYNVGPLEPGEYYFQDDVHPSANGVLVVE